MSYSPRFDFIIKKTLNFEQGYQNHANDSANYTKSKKLVGTNRGISAIAYQAYLGKEPTVAMMKAITPEIAKAVYYKAYWIHMQGDKLKSDGLAWVVFDSFIATGNLNTAIKGINTAIGSDKVVSKPYNIVSTSAINTVDTTYAIHKVIEANIIQRKNIGSNTFIDGWINRLNTLRNEALPLAFYNNLKVVYIGNNVKLKPGINLLNYWKYSADIGNSKKTITVNPSTTQNHVSWDVKYPWKVINSIVKENKTYIKIKYLSNYTNVLAGSSPKYVEAWFAADRFEMY